MNKYTVFYVVILLSVFLSTKYLVLRTAQAQDCGTDLDCQIAQIDREIKALSPAQEKNRADLANLNKQISDISTKISNFTKQLTKVEEDIKKRDANLSFTKKIFEEKARNHYTFIRFYDPITPFLFSDSATDAFREITFRQKTVESDKNTIGNYVNDLVSLKKDKEGLEKNKATLSRLSSDLSGKQKFLAGEVAKVDGYLSSLTAKQQEILAAKAGSFITSVGDIELADDYNASIKGFRESAPAGSFAVFSFGGYTHRKGMSQYGARGRAQNGQNVNQILKAYYGSEPVGKDTGGTINVAGVGNVNFEDYYLMGISEMPSTWPVEALKAQAIAARTYAYRYKVEGKQICITEACQVFRKSKADNVPESWRKAVQETRGKVLENVVTYYSSTAGGYSFTSAWDTTDGNGGGNFIDRAWEGKGGSPWLYKAWYKKGYTSSGATCAKSNPWLSGTELADLVNAVLALKKSGVDVGRIMPTSCFGGNPYSVEELRNISGGITSVTSIQVLQGNGVTNEVVVNGNIRLTGTEFKKGFNLRAPGYLRIPQGVDFGSSVDFAFFNIENK